MNWFYDAVSCPPVSSLRKQESWPGKKYIARCYTCSSYLQDVTVHDKPWANTYGCTICKQVGRLIAVYCRNEGCEDWVLPIYKKQHARLRCRPHAQEAYPRDLADRAAATRDRKKKRVAKLKHEIEVLETQIQEGVTDA